MLVEHCSMRKKVITGTVVYVKVRRRPPGGGRSGYLVVFFIVGTIDMKNTVVLYLAIASFAGP